MTRSSVATAAAVVVSAATAVVVSAFSPSSSSSLSFVGEFRSPSSRRDVGRRARRPHLIIDVSRPRSTILPTSSSSSSLSSSSSVVTDPSTFESKYPTTRGSEVDSRKLLSAPGTTGLRDCLTAVRVDHVLFASKTLAEESLSELRAGKIAFDVLASAISDCSYTRDVGGSIGWVSTTEEEEGGGAVEGKNAHLDGVLPREAREEVLRTSVKPGDVVLASSSRGYHLVRIADVMVDVRKMATIKPRRSKQKKKSRGEEDGEEQEEDLPGILGGALSSDDDGTTTKRRKDLTYKVETMGCQMNMADTERIEGQLRSLGMRPLENDEEEKRKGKHPDLVVLNTCSIRDHAEQKVYSYIGPHAKRKREGHDVTIVVAGCVAQQEGHNLLRRAPEVDLVMGPQYANRIADLLEDVSNGNQVVATEASHVMEDSTKPRRSSTVCAWVNVIYGCNERCTYCIVPTTRGVEQSRPVESVLKEVEELVGKGYKEVTLLGQNIDAYGRDMIPKRKFSDLLRSVGAVPGLERLRFVTSHPRYMSLGVVDAVAETEACCEQFHVPFQSGSNDILSAMGRGHTREKYLTIVDRIRSRLPDASITADVIVGFPGETEEQFLETLSLMEEVVFDSVNTAAYSPRPNTPAAVWEHQIPDDVKRDRLRRINELNSKHAFERRSRMMGRTVEILVEERNSRNPTQVVGRTTQGFLVYCDGDIDELRGGTVKVKVEECRTYHLAGTRVVE